MSAVKLQRHRLHIATVHLLLCRARVILATTLQRHRSHIAKVNPPAFRFESGGTKLIVSSKMLEEKMLCDVGHEFAAPS